MATTGSTTHARRTRPRPAALWRVDHDGSLRRRGWPHEDRHREPDSFEQCLALLEEAIARAERWCTRRERELAELDRVAAEIVRRLRQAGAVGPSVHW